VASSILLLIGITQHHARAFGGYLYDVPDIIVGPAGPATKGYFNLLPEGISEELSKVLPTPMLACNKKPTIFFS
tara:strand:- start:668 stop:889 length:222 start_codon:yes stop_codon:yes gene_type:complete